MPKNNKSGSEPSALPKNEASTGEIDRRLTTLENDIAEIRKTNLDGHKWFTTIFITVIFSLVGFLLAFMSNQSKNDLHASLQDMKSDVKDSIKDMGGKVDAEITTMNTKFAELSGEALKKPMLEITFGNAPLDGRIFEVNPGIHSPFYPIFIKNIGDKRTEPLSIQLSSTYDLFSSPGLRWIRTPTDEKDFQFCYVSEEADSDRTAQKGIEPGQLWALEGLPYEQLFLGISGTMSGEIKCIFRVFYGAEKPAEAKFTLKFK